MQINPKTLLAIIPHSELQELKLTVGAAVSLTRRLYCSQMTINNLCTKNCDDCAARIREAAAGLQAAKRPAGLYAARLRHQVANALEELDAQKEPEVQKNKYGERDETVDIFDTLLAASS
ncbi:MAG: hypothetical protein PVJ21_16695 [Anaerolineales bacterium]|jgi:hypothetical protein